jgi:hypothetical protein
LSLVSRRLAAFLVPMRIGVHLYVAGLFFMAVTGTGLAQVKSWTGSGPVTFRATLPLVRDERWEPLLSVGEAGKGDIVFCRRLADGRAVFGWERIGQTAVLSEAVTVRDEGPAEVLISLGSLLPPEGDDIYRNDPALGMLRNLAIVQFRGRTVLLAKGEFSPAKSAGVLGRNGVGGSFARPLFSGRIDAARGVDHRAVLAAAVAPGSLIAEDTAVTADVPTLPGPFKLQLMFPGGGGGHNEPLVTTGVSGYGDFVYVRYIDDQHLRLGFDHWRVGGPLSAPLECDITQPHEVTVSLGSLLPPPPEGGSDSPEVARLRSRCVVLLDGKVVLAIEAKFHPTTLEQVTLFSNTIGGSTANPTFTGTIMRVERVSAGEILRAAALE